MKTGTTFVVGIVCGLVITVLLIFGLFAGFIYLTHYKSQQFAEKKNQIEAEGRAFGMTTDQNGCIEKGLSLKPGEAFFDTLIQAFVGGCLKSSQPSPNFCDDVPLEGDYTAKCKKEMPNYDPCVQTRSAKQTYCIVYGDVERRKKK